MAWCNPIIEFSKEVFFPGEKVTGKVTVSTQKDMTARNVEISFFGRILTAWREDPKKRDRPVEDFCAKNTEDVFLEFKSVVWTPEDGNNTFPAGDYEWKFSYDLPKDCSASFESPYGHIRYFLRVNIDVPNWLDTIVENGITVSPTIDLNSIPGTNRRSDSEREKINHKVSCIPFLGNYGTVIYKLSLPRRGYVPGETVTISGSIENRSSKSLNEIESTLRRRVNYRDDLSRSVFKVVNPDSFNTRTDYLEFEKKTERCEIKRGETKTFEFSFVIPPVVPTIRSTKLINVEYYVTVEAGRGICDTPDYASLNLIIGNIPIMEKGTITLPPHKFVKSDTAQCWSVHLKPKFAYLVPTYGTSEGESSQDTTHN